jgi:hypothetical protein
MTIVARSTTTIDRTIDLGGPEGNAFALLGAARNFGKQLGYTAKELTALSEDMRSDDYEHLIQVFDKHFGMFVTLVRPATDEDEENE